MKGTSIYLNGTVFMTVQQSLMTNIYISLLNCFKKPTKSLMLKINKQEILQLVFILLIQLSLKYENAENCYGLRAIEKRNVIK